MTKSAVRFDHFNIERGEEVIRNEFPRGKRPEHRIRKMIAEDLASSSTATSTGGK